MKLLYVTWDGPEQNYLEALFFPVFAALRAHDVETHVLQFSWDLERFEAATTRAAREYGVAYEAHAIPRRPLQAATALAIGIGAAQLARVARRTGADVVMPRAHIPGAMALLARRAGDFRIAWDSDGLVPDERADFGGWSRSSVNYRLFRRVESSLLGRAAVTLARTAAAREVLLSRRSVDSERIQVVPNGKNETDFRPATDAERAEVRAELGLTATAPLVVYVGSVGPQYKAPEMARLVARIRTHRPDTHFLALTRAHDEMKRALDAANVPTTSTTIRQVPASDVARLLRAADAGISFREPALSMRAVCPIKVAEYLLSGVPVLANAGVGDLDAIFAKRPGGHVAPDFSDASLELLARAFVNEVLPHGEEGRRAARQLGLEEFSLSSCARGYHHALQFALQQP